MEIRRINDIENDIENDNFRCSINQPGKCLIFLAVL